MHASDDDTVVCIRLSNASEILGFALFSRRNRPLKLQLGEVTLWSVELKRLWHPGEPYIAASEPLMRDAVEACHSLLREMTVELAKDECIYFEGLPVDGPMVAAVREQNLPLLCLWPGKPYEHQFIDLPPTYADYLKQLGPRSRQSVLYSQRRLLKEFHGNVCCTCFETVDSIDKFVIDAATISKTTYQWNLLGLGLRDTRELRESLEYAAYRGWLRSYILYCGDQPAAFMLGQQHAQTYYYDDVGYDPKFTKHSVGSVLQLCVLEHLLSRPDRPRFFDFSTGYGEHKGRFGNRSRTEVDILLIRDRFANRTLLAAYNGNRYVSDALVRVVDGLGLKQRLKRFVRRRSSASSNEIG
jgi:hypothetical protein